MQIDIFCHVLPKPVHDRLSALGTNFGAVGDRVRLMRELYDMETRFRVMDEFPDYRQLISLSGPAMEEVATPAQGNEIARIANDCMAELVDRHPDRFPGFVATISLSDMDGALKELERSIDTLGACGVQLFTHVGPHPLDDMTFDPIFAAMAARGLPIWLHPGRPPNLPDYEAETESKFDMWQALGWPYATSVAVMRLIITGVFDRYPGIRLITHHMGGMIPFHPIRMERVLLRETRQAGKPGSRATPLRGAPSDYLRLIYADTAMAGSAAAVKFGIEYFGVNRVVFASDYPFNRIQPAIDMLERLELSEADKQKISAGNAIRLAQGRLR